MSIETRIQAINDHLIDDYKVLRLAGADLTGVNKNIVNLKMSWKERLLYFMNNGTDEVWNNWTKVSGTGTTLSLNNTEEAPMSLTYKGNTSQTGTPTPTSPIPVQVVSGDNSIEVCGKNVFNYADTFIDNTTTFSVANVKPNTTYYCKAYNVNDTYTGAFSMRAKINGVWTVESARQLVAGFSYTTPNNCTAIAFNGCTNPNDRVCQVEVGSQATTYEEYEGASYPISLGTNLFDIKKVISSWNSSTNTGLWNNWDGTLTVKTPSNNSSVSATSPNKLKDFCPDLKVGDSVYLTATTTGTENYFYLYGTNNTWNFNGTSPRTITQSDLDSTVLFYASGVSTTATISNIMINKGTSAKPYRPYMTPIELCKIGTYQDKIDKSTGKNVLDIANNFISQPAGSGYGKYQLNSGNGIEYVNGSDSYAWSYANCQVKTTLPAGTYTISGNNQAVRLYKSDDTLLINANQSASYKGTVTLNEDTQIGVICKPTASTGACYIMLNKGTTALPYEPYGTNWYLKKEIGKVVLNGSEVWGDNWQSTTNINGFIYRSFPTAGYFASRNAGCRYYSNHFKFSSLNSYDSDNELLYINTENALGMKVSKTTAPDLATFKTWLGNNNVSVYYVLSTPTYETITDTTLIGQLEALKKSYEGQTNISQTNNDLPFELDVTALEVMS